MSRVTNVILAYSSMDDDESGETLTAINAKCVPVDVPPFVPLDREVAGGKALEQCVLVGAFNYLDLDAFLQGLRRVVWNAPESVQLWICEEQDSVFRPMPVFEAE